MSDTALTNAELELTQKIQMHFPRGKISPKIIEQWNSCTARILSKRLLEIFGASPEHKEKLLAFVVLVKLQAVNQFVAADHFKEIETVLGVKFARFGSNFKNNFLGKVETEVEACEIKIHTLIRASRDLGIRSEIGEEREETKLAHLWQLLKFKGDGSKGALLTNGFANISYISYIRDTNGVLWVVHALWSEYGWGGWGLDADSVDNTLAWAAGGCVCSR